MSHSASDLEFKTVMPILTAQFNFGLCDGFAYFHS